jgi:hypothetical protein
MTVATGVGSLPGADAAAYTEAVRTVLGELPDLPHLPELPGRGPGAEMVGRSLAVVAELGADLQPAGWRLTDAAGVDQRRARSVLAQDLDTLEEQALGFAGRFKVQVAGPWTLAAAVERPRGDKVLADVGARRELAQALAEGLREHVGDVRRRLPGAELVVQVDEPALPAVLSGRVPTASGFHRHRSVDDPAASAALEWVFSAVDEAGATPVVHCCGADAPLSLLVGAGARGVSIDLDVLPVTAYDALATVLDQGVLVLLGVVPALPPADSSGAPAPAPAPASASAPTVRVLRLLETLGFEPESAGDRLAVTPVCGLAGAPPAWARRAMALSREVAANLRGTS